MKKVYNVKETSKLTNLSVHTIRYYTDKGLVPNLIRDEYNQRVFDDESIDWLKGIKYLRELGMSLEDIRIFIECCIKDDQESLNKRVEIFEHQLNKAKEELENAKQRVAYLERKTAEHKNYAARLAIDKGNPAKKNYNKGE